MSLRPHSSSRGFTLIEILLATAIGAIVLLVIHSVFFGALKLRNSTNDRLERSAVIQRVFSIVSSDLRGLMLPGGILSGTFQTEVEIGASSASSGTPVGPEFYTNTGRIDGRSGFADLQRVSFHLTASTDNSGRNALTRNVERNLLAYSMESPSETPLIDGIADAGFEFFDGTGWTDFWDSEATGTLPIAIKFWIQEAADSPNASLPAPASIIVPVQVQTTTSATQTEEPTP